MNARAEFIKRCALDPSVDRLLLPGAGVVIAVDSNNGVVAKFKSDVTGFDVVALVDLIEREALPDMVMGMYMAPWNAKCYGLRVKR